MKFLYAAHSCQEQHTFHRSHLQSPSTHTLWTHIALTPRPNILESAVKYCTNYNMADTEPQITPVWRNQCVTYVCFAQFPVSVAHSARAIILSFIQPVMPINSYSKKLLLIPPTQPKWKRKLHQKLKVKQSRDVTHSTLKNLISKRHREQVQQLCDNILPVINLKQPNVITWMWEPDSRVMMSLYFLWFWYLYGETWSCEVDSKALDRDFNHTLPYIYQEWLSVSHGDTVVQFHLAILSLCHIINIDNIPGSSGLW